MQELNKYKIKLFADGANLSDMVKQNSDNSIHGFTTNPTLMRNAGIINYTEFCKSILSEIRDKPISFEVFSDDFDEMKRQALEISTWGNNVNVKIPITNTEGKSCFDTVKELTNLNIKVNITAIMTLEQVESVLPALNPNVESFISIFAGRIADTGVDPVPVMKSAVKLLGSYPNSKLIWASPRELLNYVQAEQVGCHIITITNDIIKKIPLINYDLNQYSLDTVKMFFNDAQNSKYKL